jgi:hypothetical protein
MKAMLPSHEVAVAAWALLAGTKGIWSELEGSCFEAFEESCRKSNMLIDLGVGMGRLTDLVPGHSCRVHAVFWSRDVAKQWDGIAFVLGQIAATFHLRRIECVVPGTMGSLKRVMKRLGFAFEGRMTSYYKTKSAFIDGDLYAMIF